MTGNMYAGGLTNNELANALDEIDRDNLDNDNDERAVLNEAARRLRDETPPNREQALVKLEEQQREAAKEQRGLTSAEIEDRRRQT
jgi:hypothetical protein